MAVAPPTVRRLFFPLATATGCARLPRPAALVLAGLDEYIKKPDPAFAWAKTGSQDTPAGTIITLASHVSRLWQGITWKHELSVYEPREFAHADAMLLFITGGRSQQQTERK